MNHSILLIILPAIYSMIFIVIIYLVYCAQKKSSPSSIADLKEFKNSPLNQNSGAMNILQWEFEYIKTTASEAMRDRHTMINFFLIITGIVASSAITLIKKDSGIPATVGTALLWALCIIGLFYFLKIIRLRQAWRDSALAMNRIKKAFILNSDNKELLENTFLWDVDSLPKAYKRWNVFHYSAMFIGFINSSAYIAGSILLYLKNSGTDQFVVLSIAWWHWLYIIVCGFIVFFVHDYMYQKFLK
jgi:hypothetical protein